MMSEYIDIQEEITNNPDIMLLRTNLRLTVDETTEHYASAAEGDEGSPLAQTLFAIPGLVSLTVEEHCLKVERDAEIEWHDLIEDISDMLRDFFL